MTEQFVTLSDMCQLYRTTAKGIGKQNMLYWLTLTAVGLAAASLTIYASKLWQGDRYLCDDCSYNNPESCTKPERPSAFSCTAYVAQGKR